MVNKIILVLILLVVFPNVSAVVINEVMYAPNFNEYYNEWIEIYNGGPDIDLTNWTLCGKTLLEGYIDHSENETKNEGGLVLEAGKYAIITDGGSGTEVYSNFNIDLGSIALHVDASTLCTGLSNSGDNISLEDDQGNVVDSYSYDGSKALDNDNSLQLDGSWCEALPTPGSLNNCPGSIIQNETETETNQQNNNTSSNTTIEENESNSSGSTQTSSTIETGGKQEETTQNKKEELIVLSTNTDAKDIKSETTDGIKDDTKKLDKSDYIKYGLIGFSILIALLFLLKGKINKKEYKNEFNQ